jgi:hypothetical protein
MGGLYCHLDTPDCISLVMVHTKYNESRLNGSTAHG